MSSPTSATSIPIESLYQEQHSWLCAWLNRRLGNVSEAADLAQDTFVRLLLVPRPRTQWEGEDALRAPRAYLATVARRLLINHVRRQNLEQAYLETLAGLPDQAVPSPEDQILVLEALHQINTMLEGLPSKVRAVFIMAQIEEMPYADIAGELGISLRSVRRYVAQALTECILLAS